MRTADGPWLARGQAGSGSPGSLRLSGGIHGLALVLNTGVVIPKYASESFSPFIARRHMVGISLVGASTRCYQPP
jgi:hypothetical protein